MKGQLPTLDAPAPLSPDFLADLARPPLRPSMLDVLVSATVAAVLAEMETSGASDFVGQRPVSPATDSTYPQ